MQLHFIYTDPDEADDEPGGPLCLFIYDRKRLGPTHEMFRKTGPHNLYRTIKLEETKAARCTGIADLCASPAVFAGPDAIRDIYRAKRYEKQATRHWMRAQLLRRAAEMVYAARDYHGDKRSPT